jgi:uncharacterized protein (DUF2062 family)
MKQWLSKIKQLIWTDSSPQRLPAALAVGVFFAFSPLLGLQTWLIMALCWALKLNAAIAVATLWLINSPFTMIPIMVLDYAVGHVVLVRFLGINLAPYDPGFMHWINRKIAPIMQQWLGVASISLWHFIIGGFLVATIATLISYPLARSLIRRIVRQKKS